MPSKAAADCGWATVSSNRTGFGLASHPSSAPITFPAGVNTEPHPDLASVLCPDIGAQKFYPLGVWREAAVTVCQLKGFAFEIVYEACSGRKGLSGEGLGRPTTHLNCHATVGKSWGMPSFCNSEGETVRFSGYNWMMRGRVHKWGLVAKRAWNLESRPKI